jgi:hypothetical protein
LQDVGAATQSYSPGKYWTFLWDTQSYPAWQIGLVSQKEDRNSLNTPGERSVQIAWALDGRGNPYINQQTTTLNQGTPSQRVSKTINSADKSGNTLSSQIYDYAPSTPVLSRTLTDTYLHSVLSNYDGFFIRNLPLGP